MTELSKDTDLSIRAQRVVNWLKAIAYFDSTVMAPVEMFNHNAGVKVKGETTNEPEL